MFDQRFLVQHREESVFLVNRWVTDHLLRLNREFEGDLTAALVLGTIGHHNARRFYDEIVSAGDSHYSALRPTAFDGHLRPCNTQSISDSTGIPRETVRRKVAWLIRRGFVRRIGRSTLFVTPAAGEHFAPFSAAMIPRFAELLEDFARASRRVQARPGRRTRPSR